MKLKHWQDAVNAVLGVWLIVSPWVLGFSGEPVAVSGAVILGLLLLAAALGAIFVPRAWEEWTEVILGVLAIVSPWVLRMTASAARTSMVITGIVIAVLALWTLITDQDYHAFKRGGEAH